MSGGAAWQPLVVLDPAGPLPPYEQIRAQIAAWIAAARPQPGTPLPSVRQLARDLGVAPNTIVRAYDELAHSGWIAAAARKGYVVATIPAGAWDAERERRLRAAVADLLAIAWQLGVDTATLRGEIERQLAAGTVSPLSAPAAPAPPAPNRPVS
jgi:GntR family transcriptional regulator